MRPPGRRVPDGDVAWTLLALGLATIVAIVDGATSSTFALGGLALPPILASATAGPRQTLLVGLYCLLLVLLSLLWNTEDLTGGYVVQLLLVGCAGGLAFWNALVREQVNAEARGGMVFGGGAGWVDNVLERTAAAERVVQSTVPELADIAIVDLLEPDGSIRAAAIAGSDRGTTARLRGVRSRVRLDANGKSPVAEVIATGRHRLYSRMGDANWREMAVDDEHLGMLRDLAPRSMLVLPLRDHGRTFGALSLGSLSQDNRFGPGEISLAEELARRAGRSISNATIHEGQKELVDTLQSALLPRALPEIEGFEIAASFRPAAGATPTIGGDFYDIFQMREASWKAVIGDVCGKGPAAAALTSLMRDTLRAAALRGETPCESLKLLNAAILEEGAADGRFCTSVCARFELGTPVRLTVCNGGHPPPLVLRGDGAVEPVGPPGTLLGIYPDIELSDTTVDLATGDLVLLYTDGAFEFAGGNPDDAVSVEALLAECHGMSASEAIARLESRVLEAHGGRPQDDIAMLGLRPVQPGKSG